MNRKQHEAHQKKGKRESFQKVNFPPFYHDMKLSGRRKTRKENIFVQTDGNWSVCILEHLLYMR